MVANIFVFFEILITSYILFHYRVLIKRFKNKSMFIFGTFLLRYVMDYEETSINIVIFIDVLYSVFLFVIFYIVLRSR